MLIFHCGGKDDVHVDCQITPGLIMFYFGIIDRKGESVPSTNPEIKLQLVGLFVITDSEFLQMELEIGLLLSCHINTAPTGAVDLIHFLFCLNSLFD